MFSASYRKTGSSWRAIQQTGHPTQKTFETRAEAESTTLHDLLERYLEEVTPLKKGAEPETNRLRAMMRNILARRALLDASPGADAALLL